MSGCFLSIDPADMLPPGDGYESEVGDPDFHDDGPDFDMPDVEVSPDSEDCYADCPSEWTVACYGTTIWCISPWQGTGDCCTAWQACTSVGAYPGFWPTAGPYDDVPPDFFDRMELPGIVISFSGINTPEDGAPYPIANIACFGETGIKDRGETHPIPETGDCSGETCLPYLQSDVCEGDNIGCGCDDLPYWCVIYDD